MSAMRLILGFLIQILPCAYFCMWPFRGRMRLKGRWIALLGAALAVVVLPVFVWAGSRPGVLGVQLGNVVFMAAVAACLGFFILVADGTRMQKFFIFLLAVHYGFFNGMLSYLLPEQLLPALGDLLGIPLPTYPGNMLYAGTGLLSLLLATVVTLPFIPPVERRLRLALDAGLDEGVWRRLCILVGGYLVLPDGALFGILLLDWEAMRHSMGFLVLSFCILAFNFILCCVALWTVEYARREAVAQLGQQRVLDDFIAVESSIRQAQRARQELRHHVMVLRLFYNQGDYQDLGGYLEELSLWQEDVPEVGYSPNLTVNAICSGFASRAAERGIRTEIEVEVPESLPMDGRDLYLLLAGALEEVLTRCGGSPGWAEIHLRRSGRLLALHCACSAVAEQGVASAALEALAKRYDGGVRTGCRDGRFTLEASLILPAGGTEPISV